MASGGPEPTRPNKRASEHALKKLDDMYKRVRALEKGYQNKTAIATSPGTTSPTQKVVKDKKNVTKEAKQEAEKETLRERIENEIGYVQFKDFVSIGLYKGIIKVMNRIKDDTGAACLNGVLFDTKFTNGKCPRAGCTAKHPGGELMPEGERRQLLLEALGA